jgi:hypothetical protein
MKGGIAMPISLLSTASMCFAVGAVLWFLVSKIDPNDLRKAAGEIFTPQKNAVSQEASPDDDPSKVSGFEDIHGAGCDEIYKGLS